MIKVEYSYLVNSPVDFVFSYISNPLNDQYWQASCLKVELMNPARRWARVRNMRSISSFSAAICPSPR